MDRRKGIKGFDFIFTKIQEDWGDLPMRLSKSRDVLIFDNRYVVYQITFQEVLDKATFLKVLTPWNYFVKMYLHF